MFNYRYFNFVTIGYCFFVDWRYEIADGLNSSFVLIFSTSLLPLSLLLPLEEMLIFLLLCFNDSCFIKNITGITITNCREQKVM